jgi:hypothetical protein
VQVELEDVKIELETAPSQPEKEDAMTMIPKMAEAQLRTTLPH